MRIHKYFVPLAFLALLPIPFYFYNPSFFKSRNQILPIYGQEFSNASYPQIYIVQVLEPKGAKFISAKDTEKWHRSFLPSTTLDSGLPRLVYSYTHAISGFAARLTSKEVSAMKSMDGFLEAHPAHSFTLHTTYSPQFLGLHQGGGLWGNTSYGKGVIIGVLDDGVLPTHLSFKDDGMADKPKRWKGSCEFNPPSLCNKKLIGAIGIDEGQRKSPEDYNGHGTNTASIAAGNFVTDANVLGNARGTAAGIAPHAHLAIYKVCFNNDCNEADILAGINQAIKDGVDVLSVSLGYPAERFYDDDMAIAAFRATRKGILVSCSAGNDGPFPGTVENDAPWILTVGASTMDRTLRATVKLGNGVEINGEVAYQPIDFPSTMLSLIYPGANGDQNAMSCNEGSLNKPDVEGKIVMCHIGGSTDATEKGEVVRDAGGAALILMNDEQNQNETDAEDHVLPASHIGYSDSLKLIDYVKTSSPTATIVFKGTMFDHTQSPRVSYLSGRGPSKQNGGILKPDIVGPGVNILAASHSSTAAFEIVSGTSMSTPHLAGVAALLKASHMDWSPAAIKSAIMTSSDMLDHTGRPIADEKSNAASLFAIGSGHVNPTKANDPGLVYDIQPNDYISYLCGLGYTDKQVKGITGINVIKCSDVDKISADQLNYPSFALYMKPNSQRTVRRTVTNVGKAESTYSAKKVEPKGVSVEIIPKKITFTKLNQKVSFSVTFKINTVGSKGRVPEGSVSEGRLWWKSKTHNVTSPISITFI